MMITLDNLQQSMGYIFQDASLLQHALTHKSYAINNNERLEFLGDSILNCIVAKILFDKFSQADEGTLTKMRSQFQMSTVIM